MDRSIDLAQSARDAELDNRDRYVVTTYERALNAAERAKHLADIGGWTWDQTVARQAISEAIATFDEAIALVSTLRASEYHRHVATNYLVAIREDVASFDGIGFNPVPAA